MLTYINELKKNYQRLNRMHYHVKGINIIGDTHIGSTVIHNGVIKIQIDSVVYRLQFNKLNENNAIVCMKHLYEKLVINITLCNRIDSCEYNNN